MNNTTVFLCIPTHKAPVGIAHVFATLDAAERYCADQKAHRPRWGFLIMERQLTLEAQASSPYLNIPPRTEEQARRDLGRQD